MINVTILNGPSKCGKDFAVKQLVSQGHLLEHCSFKRRIHEIAAKMMGVSDESWHLNYELVKDCPDPLLGGKTIRDLMIHVSENAIKPFFGRDHMGQQELTRVKRIASAQFFARDFIFTDGGFIEEIEPFMYDRDIKLTIIKIQREGCSFAGDSRGYINPQGVNVYNINNNGDDSFVSEIKNILDRERVSEESFCKER
jgi:hypothetical protein